MSAEAWLIADETRTRLDQVLRREKDWIGYEYDFGDDWSHRIVLEKRLPPDPALAVPHCIGGKRACPPEDIGGVHGYYKLLEAMADPSDPRHEELSEWHEGYDPEAFDPERVSKRLAEVRPAAPATGAKPRRAVGRK